MRGSRAAAAALDPLRRSECRQSCLKACALRCRSVRERGMTDETLCLHTSGASGWSSSSSVVEVVAATTALGPQDDEVFDPVLVARTPGFATVSLCDSGMSAGFVVRVASGAKVVLESVPTGGPSPMLAAARLLSNDASTPGKAVVVPVRFYASSGEGGAGFQLGELLSGPFHHQGLKFQCEPTEAGMKDFFDFEAWSLDAVASRQSKAVLPLLAGSPQAACILRPKQTPTGQAWAKQW